MGSPQGMSVLVKQDTPTLSHGREDSARRWPSPSREETPLKTVTVSDLGLAASRPVTNTCMLPQSPAWGVCSVATAQAQEVALFAQEKPANVLRRCRGWCVKLVSSQLCSRSPSLTHFHVRACVYKGRRAPHGMEF